MKYTVALLGAFVISMLSTRLWITLANKYAIVDLPNKRSSHDRPRPRGGGVAIIVSFFAVLIWFYIRGEVNAGFFAATATGLLIAGIGFLDDCVSVPIRWRLGAQILCAVVATFLCGIPQATGLHDSVFLWQAGLWLVTIIGIVWQTNLFNFMDGIDGLAGSQAAFVAGAAAILCLSIGEYVFGMISAALGCASLGFLVWNWPPAKVFMGDVGSGFVGFTFAVLALSTSVYTDLSIWTWIILMGAFIVDASVTAARRFLLGEVVYSAHRSHAYQWSARRHGSHLKVTAAFLLLNVLWLFPFAIASMLYESIDWRLAVAALSPLAIVAYYLGAGHPEPAQ